jgi:hypothetical protein
MIPYDGLMRFDRFFRWRGEGGRFSVLGITLVRCHPTIPLFMVSWRTTPNDLQEGIGLSAYSNLM